MSVRIRVPATTANLGPGFDVFGMSLSLYNILEFEERPNRSVRIEVSGEGVEDVPRVPDYNLAYRGFARYFSARGRQAPGVRLHIYNEIPVTRGLGSSATAIVSGLCAASLLDGREFDRDELLRLAVEIEGHPDNVAPAIYGGFVASGLFDSQKGTLPRLHTLRLTPPAGLTCVVAVPGYMLSTGTARRALPAHVPFRDATQNVRNASLLTAAMASGDLALIQRVFADAMQDSLHEPYRFPLIKGGVEAARAAKDAGAFAVAISGSGPSLLALTTDRGMAVGDAMRRTFAQMGVATRILQLKPETNGVHVL
ncbi:homoserine kinase [Tumebacillus sp. ITR2]|uniref:Homoserine kinase n=1 Tax=Tumebacillus amylolyticus TaxID=2801339 RepID=A0ABS1J9R9_9BACL|nr:homoserine kinase [Tumebacillus amylolyticus]MBL0387024.1 homoserine kinase [Tumebacillus amylolyticus]